MDMNDYIERANRVIDRLENVSNIKVINSKYMAIRLYYCECKCQELTSCKNASSLDNVLSDIDGECYTLLNNYFTGEFLEQLYEEYSEKSFSDRYRFYIYSSFELQGVSSDTIVCSSCLEDSLREDLTEDESKCGVSLLGGLSDYYRVKSDHVNLIRLGTIDLAKVIEDLSGKYDITIQQAEGIVDPTT